MRLPHPKEVRGFLAEGCRQLLEKPLYSGAISAFGVGVKVAGFKNSEARLLSEGQKEIWRRLDESIEADARYIWVHAASLASSSKDAPLSRK